MKRHCLKALALLISTVLLFASCGSTLSENSTEETRTASQEENKSDEASVREFIDSCTILNEDNFVKFLNDSDKYVGGNFAFKVNNILLESLDKDDECWSRAESTTQSRRELTNFSRSEIANVADDFLL